MENDSEATTLARSSRLFSAKNKNK